MTTATIETFSPAWEGQRCSLGYEAVAWIEANCCYGPGDLQGQPAKVDDEMYDFIRDSYLIDEVTGRKVYDEGVLSRPKGRAKTEIAGWLVCFEAFGPARFSHWDESGQPVGKRVTSPLIKCLATEESQATAAFSVVAYVIDWGKENGVHVYDGVSGARQYQSATALYIPSGGEIRACSSGAASKDGGKETFVVCDESHLYVLPELKRMYATIRRNLGKRKIAEPWMLQTTTAYRPGEQSIAEETLTAWRKQELSESVLVDHREAKGPIRIKDKEHTVKQLTHVYGAASEWMDFERLHREMLDPRSCPDEATAARYFLNRPMTTRDAWIPTDIHERQMVRDVVELGDSITLGFDGSFNDDATVLRGCRMSDGYLFRIGAWPKPENSVGWEVPRSDVLATFREAFTRYDVVRAYCDPHEWRSDIDTLAVEFGDKRVVPWETRRDTAMAYALDRLHSDLMNGQVFHDDDPLAAEHYGNAYARHRGSLRLVRKEHPNSPRKIDSVVADALAYEARADALADGWGKKQSKFTRVKGRSSSF
jgi:phage terminase large subunit-like protein